MFVDHDNDNANDNANDNDNDNDNGNGVQLEWEDRGDDERRGAARHNEMMV